MEKLISMRDLDKEEILGLIQKTEKIESKEINPDLKGKVISIDANDWDAIPKKSI